MDTGEKKCVQSLISHLTKYTRVYVQFESFSKKVSDRIYLINYFKVSLFEILENGPFNKFKMCFSMGNATIGTCTHNPLL